MFTIGKIPARNNSDGHPVSPTGRATLPPSSDTSCDQNTALVTHREAKGRSRQWAKARFRALAVVSLLPVAGCGWPMGGSASPQAATSHVTPATASVETTDVVGVCIDGTASTISEFSQRQRQLVAGAVEAWAPDPPRGVPQAGVSGSPGLDLQLRKVSVHSFGSQQPAVSVRIPAVQGVPAQPDPSNPTFASQEQQRDAEKPRYLKDARAAHRDALAGAREIAAFRLNGAESEIRGCVSAAAEFVNSQSGSIRRILLASDLMQNEPQQTGGSLRGTDVLIVQACHGDAADCTRRKTVWSSALKKQGASSVTITRPDDVTQQTISAFLHGQ